jgi:hypothetical protein
MRQEFPGWVVGIVGLLKSIAKVSRYRIECPTLLLCMQCILNAKVKNRQYFVTSESFIYYNIGFLHIVTLNGGQARGGVPGLHSSYPFLPLKIKRQLVDRLPMRLFCTRRQDLSRDQRVSSRLQRPLPPLVPHLLNPSFQAPTTRPLKN